MCDLCVSVSQSVSFVAVPPRSLHHRLNKGDSGSAHLSVNTEYLISLVSVCLFRLSRVSRLPPVFLKLDEVFNNVFGVDTWSLLTSYVAGHGWSRSVFVLLRPWVAW